VVWQVDLPDISGTHLHPGDMRGAIVSLDRADPPGSWRWGGPAWTGQAGVGAPGRLEGATLAVGDPGGVAERWGRVLGVGAAGAVLSVDDASIAFEPTRGEEELTEIAVALPAEVRAGRDSVDIGGARFRLRDA
jgi:hypothetical protein